MVVDPFMSTILPGFTPSGTSPAKNALPVAFTRLRVDVSSAWPSGVGWASLSSRPRAVRRSTVATARAHPSHGLPHDRLSAAGAIGCEYVQDEVFATLAPADLQHLIDYLTRLAG